MASSDDEGEAVPHTVSNYHFVGEKEEPVAFLELPVQWNDGEELDRDRKQIFLHGTADNGLQKIYKQVIAWKFDIADLRPEIFVLSKENNWIKLQKPRKSFEDIIRSGLITVHCLHLVRKNPETSMKSLWDQLSRVFSSYETRPSENDLIDHITLISEAVKRDETLAKSKFLVTFLEEKPRKKKLLDEDIGTTPAARFIVDDDMIDEFEDDDGSDEEQDLFDSVCSICDNGGELLCCEGRCMRSFHATEEAGSESACESLGYSDKQVEAIQNFFCKNCQYKQHQCFACGELGSSDKLSGAEVFPCVSATCGRFYHPHCVAKLLHHDKAAAAEELQKKIASGESFTCSIHKCIVCKQGEDKTDPDLQFAVCRRCPKSYHRKCLPRKIAFEDMEDEGIIQRAWEGLIPNRILIYCLKHEIDEELGTPFRNHIKFPGVWLKKKKQEPQQLLRNEKVIQKKSSLTSEDDLRRRTFVKLQKGAHLSSPIKQGDSSKKSMRRLTGLDSSKKLKGADTFKKRLSSSSLGERLHDLMMSKGSKDSTERECRETTIDKPVPKDMSNLVQLDDDSKQRIMALVKNATSSVTMEEVLEKHKLPKTHASSSKYVVDKAITLGKVEGSVEAVRAALQKLEEGGSIEDAKAVCEPGLLHQIIRWKNKLRVYLSPFIYGMRYTSFGRHFTKVDKLKQIVDVLHYYVQDGDMIVDFCCGANDFSWLMKMKLDGIGKKCSYKNFDILQAKNDFNFEKRDWMSVQTRELPTGSQLIMGLNPPFGVNAGLANKFIEKALEFKPKLLILIVPKETERLDKKKKLPYDLIWEDDELLAGRSFYLPGSVDVNDNQLEDWNVSTPPLYLWSRPDWTAKHMAIAQQHGHLSRVREGSHQEEDHKSLVSDQPSEDHDLNGKAPMPIHDHSVQNEVQLLPPEGVQCVYENREEGVSRDNVDEEVQNSHTPKNQTRKYLKRKHDKEEHVSESGKTSQSLSKRGKNSRRSKGRGQHVRESDKASQRSKVKQSCSDSHTHGALPYRSPPNLTDDNSSRLRGSQREASNEKDHHLDKNIDGSRSHSITGYGVTHMNDVERSYRLNSEEPYSGPSHRLSMGTSPNPGPDYGVRNPEEHFTAYRRESIDSYGYRPSYLGGVEEQYARSSAIGSQLRLYGQQEPSFSQRSSYLGSGPDPVYSSLYSGMGLVMEPPMNTSTMQRYAPRLDELNHTRINNSGYDQSTAGRPGISNPLAPQPGYRVDSLGFASGPHRPFSHQNSSGWLNE